MSYPSVFAILVTFNQCRQTIEALHSVLTSDYPDLHAIVVDNGSTDGTVECISETFPQVTVVANSRNLGYAEGCNIGMRWAMNQGGEYVFLLNNDVLVAQDALTILVETSESTPHIGIVGPKLYRWGSPGILQSVGGIIDWAEVRSVLIGDSEQDLGQYDKPRKVAFVSGSALLAKRTVLERVGLMDSMYFMYYEEVDWCLRAQQAGFSVFYVPEACVWHKNRGSSASDPYLVNYFTMRNRLLFGARYAGWQGKIYLIRLSFVTLIKALWHLRNGKQRGWSRAVTLGILDFCLGRFGPGSYLTGR